MSSFWCVDRNNKEAYPEPCREFTLKESFWFALTSFTPQVSILLLLFFHTGEYFLDRGDDNENDDDSFKYDADDDKTKNDNYSDTGWWQ